MSEDKNIRDWDRLLLRVPDGLKEWLSSRAQANKRSMNAEAIAILTRALGEPNEMYLRELEKDLRDRDSEIASVREILDNLIRSRAELVAEIDSVSEIIKNRRKPGSDAAKAVDATIRAAKGKK